MNSTKVNKQSPSTIYTGDASPPKLMPGFEAYDKENIPSPQGTGPILKTLKASGRLSLPLNLNTSIDRPPFVPDLNRPLPRRGRVTDGGATCSLTTSEAGGVSPQKSPEKRTRQDQGGPIFENWALAEEDPWGRVASGDEGLEGGDVRTLRANKVADMLPVANMWPRRRRAITEDSACGIDAHFSAAWDEATGRAALSTSGHTHFLPAFEEDDVFGGYHEPLGREDGQGDQMTADLLSHESGGKKVRIDGDIPEGSNSADVFDAAAVSDADDFDDSLFPLPVLLASRVYDAIEPCVGQCPPQIMEKYISRILTSTVPVARAVGQDAPSLPPAQEEQEDAISFPVEGTPAASLEVPQLPKTKPGPMTRAAKTRSELAVGVDLRTPQPPKAQKTLPRGATKTGRKVNATHDPSVARQPQTKGAKTTQKSKVPQAPSNGIVGSGTAGPSNSTPTAQTIYPPALAQEIWELAETGSYLKAHKLFASQDKSICIDGAAEVQKYLLDHPEAGQKLKPLTKGGPRTKLYLCPVRAFWVPIEKEGEEQNGPRDFVLEYNTSDCPYGYATLDNYNKHVYKFHLKKTYGNYPKKGSAQKKSTKPARGKGKTPQTQKNQASKKDEDEYESDVGEDDD